MAHMGFTRADMRNIFQRGILQGLCNAEAYKDADTCDAASAITEEGFENALAAIREQKAIKSKESPYDPEKEIEEWIKSGGRKGHAPIPGLYKEIK
jgi:hypothetical protein